jgi:hypothetical protein
MKKVQEIKKEELTELQDLVKNFNQHQLKLGELEIEKHQILHGASKVQEDLQKFQDGLREEYGDITININDGSFEKIENEADTKD